MRIVRFAHTTGIAWGALDGDTIARFAGDPFTGTPTIVQRLPLLEATLLAPAVPTKVVAVGRNYAGHVSEMGWAAQEPPVLFLKPPSSVVGPEDEIVIPEGVGRCEPEGELAVVIGRAGSRIPVQEAADHILGYTIANDVSARDLMVSDGQWSRAKGLDSFCPLGPWIETDLDAGFVTIVTRVNGSEVQRGATSEMRIDVLGLVAHISRAFRLEAGDVILTGSPAGRAPLADEDRVEVEISGIGVLRNHVRHEVRAISLA